jgi:hypothetical protein
VYQRIVCFKFKADTSPEAIKNHMRDFAALKAEIPLILNYSGGMMIPSTEQPPQYDSLHYLTFQTPEAIDLYFAHPAHHEIWERVLVLNASCFP